MRTKDILVVLLPSTIFVVMAVAALLAAGTISLDSKDRETRRKLDDLVHKVQSGELHPSQETLVQMVRDSRDLQDEGRQTAAKALRILGCASLCAVGLQIYLILRLRAGTSPVAETNQSLHSTPR
jgi:hypothetical protein